MIDNNTQAFFALLRAGLWEQDVWLSAVKDLDYKKIYQLADEQSVVGILASGLEHVVNVKIPQDDALLFVGNALQLEQMNTAMNTFVGGIVERMREAGIYALLLKGQGISQCYEKPLWRACGNIDLFLSSDNFDKAKKFLTPLASSIDDTDLYKLHLPMNIDSWVVELHGTLRGGLWRRIDRELDEVQSDIFYSGYVRSWMNGNTQIFLPRADEDVVLVFSHILQHFFHGGIGLRQICDWCRLMWTYRKDIDVRLLETRVRKMGALTEWKAFAAFAVEYLGMPVEAIPLYSPSHYWKRKAPRIMKMVMETGNFRQNPDLSYQNKSFVARKTITLWRLSWDSVRQMLIFPIDPLRVWGNMFVQRMNLLISKRNGHH